ncbi:replication factor A2 [Sporothrix brasiliensis 5110]|uniref:Replication factor A2 n=1 Tax=Sporothrix brasiliensis 5110 TaxID=1398154 RepID=A0A0C2ITN7_9PEZI|nr:replication factor A2 [Sporothrix brasiliensis 5110]KIH90130.1 replication factor A2 [Sporothrix brasiliensis 5110]
METASYGAYTKPGYSADGGNTGGGFMSGSQSGSQGGGGGRNYNEDSLRPVTVKQLVETEEAYPGAAEFTIDGAAITQLTLVGQVRAVNPQPTNVTYRIDDGTGSIDVKKWVDADKSEDEAEAPFALDQYVRVSGRLKLFNQKRYVAAHFLRAVDDYNEVSYHALESTYVHLSLTRGAPGGANGANGYHNKGEDGMFVDQDAGGASYGVGGGGGGGGGMGGRNMSGDAQKVFNLLRNMATGSEGVDINVMKNELHISLDATMAAVQELVDSSVIYATTDDSTFALLE